MTMWKPHLTQREGPIYLAIANSISEDVANGRLAEGQRLPPQRDLADELSVALTTVTRAYAEAERRGLVSGEVGRGTFVTRREWVRLARPDEPGAAIDLTVNSLLPHPFGKELIQSMGSILSSSDPWSVLDYYPHQGSRRAREAGALLASRVGLDVSPDQVLVTTGAQHAMAVVFSTLANPGDTVLTGELTYTGMKSVANLLHVRLRGLAMDEQGIRADAFEAACITNGVKALYCMPSLQNPTSAVMSDERRQQIVRIAQQYEVSVVEDDSYGFLVPEKRALSSFAPNGLSSGAGYYFLTGVSKSLAPGLRIGFIAAPPEMVNRLAASISGTNFLTPPPMAEVVAQWIFDGTADKVAAWKREEMQTRQTVARDHLRGYDYRAHPSSPHGWLVLPEPWCVRDFVEQARMRGVLVSPAEDFAIGRSSSAHAVRLCLGPVCGVEPLERALTTLKEILGQPPEPCHTLI